MISLNLLQSHTTVTPDDIRLEAESPTGRLIKMNGDGMYHAQFGHDEIGKRSVISTSLGSC